jgi:hypothetical protein
LAHRIPVQRYSGTVLREYSGAVLRHRSDHGAVKHPSRPQII